MESQRKSASYILRISSGKSKVLYIDQFSSDSATLKPVAEDYDKPLWFSREIMFADDRKILQKLESAYRTNEREMLERLWSQLEK